ncbi:hypothetical protein [Clostridium intestinale]|nr:hypothetical protein [Clostridium intestinale]
MTLLLEDPVLFSTDELSFIDGQFISVDGGVGIYEKSNSISL